MVTLLAGVSLGGCVEFGRKQVNQVQPTAAVKAPPPRVEPVPQVIATPVATTKKQAKATKAPATEETKPEVIEVDLVGKSEGEIASLLGRPTSIDQRGASTVWVYKESGCDLDVYFFMDVAKSDRRVLAIEPAGDEEAAPALERCYGNQKRS